MKKNTIGLPTPPQDQFWSIRWSPDGSSVVLELKDGTRLFDNVIVSDTLEVEYDFEYIQENITAMASIMLDEIVSKKDLVNEINDKLIGEWL